MSQLPSEVKIKLKRGAWEIEITCAEDRIKQAVEAVVAGLATNVAIGAGEVDSASVRSSTTCRELIRDLWGEGWFSSERTLGEVHEELARKGYHYDRTAVSHSLTDLVRETVLSRLGTMRNYRYVQKRPPTQQQ